MSLTRHDVAEWFAWIRVGDRELARAEAAAEKAQAKVMTLDADNPFSAKQSREGHTIVPTKPTT